MSEIINRIEIIDETGRVFVKYLDVENDVEISMQDNGKTMKIFLKPNEV